MTSPDDDIARLAELPTSALLLVDPLVAWPQQAKAGAEKHFGNGKESCHMTVDGRLDALHAFARRIGLKRSWFQSDGSLPHYDLTPGKRSQALALGALAIDWRASLTIRKARSAAGHAQTNKGCACERCMTVCNGGARLALNAWEDALLEAQLASPEWSRHHIAGVLKKARRSPFFEGIYKIIDELLVVAIDLFLDKPDFAPTAAENTYVRSLRGRVNEMLSAVPVASGRGTTDDLELVGELMRVAAPPAKGKR